MNGRGRFLCNTNIQTNIQMTLSPRPKQEAWQKKMTNSLAWNKVNITKSYIIHENVSFYSWRYLKFHQKLTFETSITCFPLSELQIVFVTCTHFCLGDQKAWPENRLLGMARRSSSPDIAHVKLVVPWGKYFVETLTN